MSTSTAAHLVLTKLDAAGNATALADLGLNTRLEAFTSDPLGFIYIGYTKPTGEVVVDRYNASGTRIYSASIGATNRLENIQTDAAGNLYIAWTDNIGEVLLEKHQADGGRIYLINQDATGMSTTRFNGMAADALGHLYAGLTNKTGNLVIQWVNETASSMAFANLGVGSQLNSILPDGQGSTFVSYIDATGHLLLGKFTAGGAQTFSIDLGAGSRPAQMVKDNSNNVYLLWTSTAGHLFVNKYSASGAQAASIDQGTAAQAAGLTVDAGGNYFVASISNTAHLIINKYSSSNTPATPLDLGVSSRLNDMAIDSGSALYVLWTSSTAHLQANKYSAAGAPVYSIDLGRGNQWNGTAIGGAGNIYVEYTASNANLTATQLNSTGGSVYSVNLGAGARSSGAPSNVAGNLVDPAGNAYVSWINGGTQTIAKYDPSGNVLHTRSAAAYQKYLTAVDDGGNSYTAFVSGGVVLEKRNAAGTTMYSVALPNGADLQYLAADPAGDAYVGWTATGGAAFFEKYDAGGTQGYSVPLGPGANLTAAKVDLAGFAYVGYSTGAGVTFKRIDPAGTAAYTLSFGVGTVVAGLAVDSGGNMILARFDNPGALTITKYNFHGDVFFTKALVQVTRLYAVTTDNVGCVYYAYGDAAGLHLAKSDAAGNPIYSTVPFSIVSFSGFALDGVGEAFIAYTDSAAALHVIKYGVGNYLGGSTSGVPVYNLNLGAGSTLWSLSVDSPGNAYVAFSNNASQLTFAKYNAIGGPDFSANLGTGLQIGAVTSDSAGNGYIGYTNGSAVSFARYNGGGGAVYTLPLSSGGRFALSGSLVRATTTADSASVPAGAPIGFTISLVNTAPAGGEFASGIIITDALPAGSGINWTISPAYSGPGTCAISGAVGSQVLLCSVGGLGPQAAASVHLASTTNYGSCLTYSQTPSVTSVNGTLSQPSATTQVQCPAGCAYSIDPTTASISSAGGNGTVSVAAPVGCAWTTSGSTAAASITGGSSGTGVGTVSYSATPNSSPLQRTFVLTIAGQAFTLVQQPPVGTNNEAFVRQLYLDILNRTAEPTGLNTWVNWINTGQYSRAQVASQFFQSPEFSLSGSYITKLYLAIMLRDPDYGGWTGWFAYLRSGHSQTEILNQFLGSAEFQQRYGNLDNTAFVTLVYNNVLGRAPDSAGLAQWVAWLNAGTYTRADVMNGFITSPEFDLRVHNRVYANMLYIGFLRRVGEPAGLDGWTNWLNNGTYTLDQVVGGFISSPEYLLRF